MSYDRGDVVVAADPFKDDDAAGRPFLVINHPETPFHGEQYIVVSLTTRTWYDERIQLTAEDWVDGGAPEASSVMPWSVTSVRSEWIEYRQGTLREDIVAQAVTQLVAYIE